MQWLIDIISANVIATIGIPPTYIDRGDPANFDFDYHELTSDGTWRDLDLSSIVPAGATAVALSMRIQATTVSLHFRMRKKGNTKEWNISTFNTVVANTAHEYDAMVSVDNDRKIQYNIATGTWPQKTLTVKGWWL